MIRILLFFLFFSFSSVAEITTVTGEHSHLEDVSIKEGCELAKKDAFAKAKEKVLGLKIFSEESEICSSVDGRSKCLRNQLFLSETLGAINSHTVIETKKDQTKFDNSEKIIYICKVTVKAKVEKYANTLNTSYNFNVALNNLAFRENDELEINIDITKPVYLNIFQWLPYETKDDQIFKIFPNKIEQDNYLDKNISLPIIEKPSELNIKDTRKKTVKYIIEFPKNVKSNKVDESLIFIFSKEKIDFFDKYLKREELIKKYMREKDVKLIYKSYTIIK